MEGGEGEHLRTEKGEKGRDAIGKRQERQIPSPHDGLGKKNQRSRTESRGARELIIA